MAAMPYSEAAPSQRLADWVERVSFSSDGALGRPPAVLVVPDGGVDVLFSVASGGACSASVFGVKTRALRVESDGPVENVALRLRAGAAARLFGLSAAELTDREVSLDDLAGAPAREWAERVAEATDSAGRHAALARGFGAWAARAARAPDADDALLRAAVACVRRARGALSIAALGESLGIGGRRLERLFQARVGVTPKAFARIARFFAAYESLRVGRELLDVALAHGYFDQAHLNRDFRELAGAPPRRIFPSEASGAGDSLRA
jgi:AraC-like DNA-binding protein